MTGRLKLSPDQLAATGTGWGAYSSDLQGGPPPQIDMRTFQSSAGMAALIMAAQLAAGQFQTRLLDTSEKTVATAGTMAQAEQGNTMKISDVTGPVNDVLGSVTGVEGVSAGVVGSLTGAVTSAVGTALKGPGQQQNQNPNNYGGEDYDHPAHTE